MRSSARSLTSTIAMAMVTLVLASCGSVGASTADDPGGSTETATSIPDSATSPPDSETSAPTQVGATLTRAAWVSPTGNIACTYDALGSDRYARCDLRSGGFTVPAELEQACEFDMGMSMVVDAEGARPACVSDMVQGQTSEDAETAGWWTPTFGASEHGEAILPYEHSIGGNPITCESRDTGMTCRLGEHGFTINATSYAAW